MTYKQTIEKNCSLFYPEWWPKYAYHFTDVTNAVSILQSGILYSRSQATQRGVMENDNASRQVIDITDARTASYVRFYFRPLTPTQYNNEGYKHIRLRYNDDVYANIPVPVFFIFDLNTLLQTNNVIFSPLSQAGYGNPTYSGEEAFAKMPFDKIYSNGPCDDETRHYRHAEILCPDSYRIDDALISIVCRNECEKSTLLNMLFVQDSTAYYKYKEVVRVARSNLFYRNGLYVENVNYHDNILAIEFACTPEKTKFESRKKAKNLPFVKTRCIFQWSTKQGRILWSTANDLEVDYLNPGSIMFKLPIIDGASVLSVTMYFEGKIQCVFRQDISPYELI